MSYLQSKSNNAVSPENLQTLKRYSNALVQNIRMKSGASDRDYSMAENVKWLMQESKDARIIVSADNTHVTKASGKMGNYLAKTFGNDYLVLGATYNSGTYSAYGGKEFYEVHPSFVGTYEYFFQKANTRILSLT